VLGASGGPWRRAPSPGGSAGGAASVVGSAGGLLLGSVTGASVVSAAWVLTVACRVALTFTVALDGDATALLDGAADETGALDVGSAATGATVWLGAGVLGELLPDVAATATPPPATATIAAALAMTFRFMTTPPKGVDHHTPIPPEVKAPVMYRSRGPPG
jgi:hypothetical protein